LRVRGLRDPGAARKLSSVNSVASKSFKTDSSAFRRFQSYNFMVSILLEVEVAVERPLLRGIKEE
jgi:hypothetical protein